MKLVVLYKEPSDRDQFDREYEKHKEVVDKVPGLQELRLTRFSRTLAGDGYYLMAELIFPDSDTFKEAMKSSEMAETGKDANRFASGLMTMMVGSEQ